MSIFQSFGYRYLKAMGRGEEIIDWKQFLMGVLVESPITGVAGNTINDLLHGDPSKFLSTSGVSPLIPIVKTASKTLHSLATGEPGKASAEFIKGAEAFTIIKNFPILGALWRKQFLLHLYDSLYPDNKYKQEINSYLKSRGTAI